MAKKMADMTMMPLDAPQPRYNVPDLSGIPDTEEDKPLPGEILVTIFHQASHRSRSHHSGLRARVDQYLSRPL